MQKRWHFLELLASAKCGKASKADVAVLVNPGPCFGRFAAEAPSACCEGQSDSRPDWTCCRAVRSAKSFQATPHPFIPIRMGRTWLTAPACCYGLNGFVHSSFLFGTNGVDLFSVCPLPVLSSSKVDSGSLHGSDDEGDDLGWICRASNADH